MTMILSTETPSIVCMFIEDVNRGVENMSNGKVGNATLLTNELLKWTSSGSNQLAMDITNYHKSSNQAIKQGF